MIEYNDCLCKPKREIGGEHEPMCPEGTPTESERAWMRACREGDFELWEFQKPDFGLKKRQYIWEMMRHKARISDQAKVKAKENFENSVCRYAAYIENGRQQAEDMAEYRRITQ